MINVRIHRRQGEHLVAACDSGLEGRVLQEGKIKMTVHSSFYCAEEVDEATLRNRLEMATVANLVGEKSVGVAIDMGLIEMDCVIMIDGVPHAQMARL